MTDSTPVGRVAAALEDAGYQRIANGLQVGELKFQFPAAFVKAKSSAELILVADIASESETQLTRKVDGVARALDIASSTRSLTLVVTGLRPSASALESMGRVCRVLPIGDISGDDGDEVLMNWLAVLLPLPLPQPESVAGNSLARIHAAAQSLDETTRKLINAASLGERAVRKGLYSIIDAAAVQAKEKNT
ncbi:hypothetical protein [Salinicola sp. MIT1003]|uniref:hypothetical protein n=1 Tax=Salinicola sp. MIT1003 TaxID=1882734 RepID=UPI0008DCBFFD|nr:hypothetical protein [Salinicola sp. MIT1003]OHZ00185.1 hypothetical protein BC443_10555 [Salinicola sp. MIT1003]